MDNGDPTLKDRLDVPKLARQAAVERVRPLDARGAIGATAITGDSIARLAAALRQALHGDDPASRKAYLRLFVDEVVVGDNEICIQGPTAALAKAAINRGLPAPGNAVPSFVREWRPVGDSNPCYRRERAVSWASRRTGQQPRGGF